MLSSMRESFRIISHEYQSKNKMEETKEKNKLLALEQTFKGRYYQSLVKSIDVRNARRRARFPLKTLDISRNTRQTFKGNSVMEREYPKNKIQVDQKFVTKMKKKEKMAKASFLNDQSSKFSLQNRSDKVAEIL